MTRPLRTATMLHSRLRNNPLFTDGTSASHLNGLDPECSGYMKYLWLVCFYIENCTTFRLKPCFGFLFATWRRFSSFLKYVISAQVNPLQWEVRSSSCSFLLVVSLGHNNK